jgi:hypothetical protein
MTLRKVDWLFIRNPMVPRTAEHAAVKVEKDCVSCHSAGAVRPLPARHPKRPDCFRCHARQT